LDDIPPEDWEPEPEPDGLPGPIPGVYDDQGAADPDDGFRALLGFPTRDVETLETVIRKMYDPDDGSFRDYLSFEEYMSDFAPTSYDFDLLKAWLEHEGFSVNFEATNRLLIQFSGSVADFNETFNTELHICMRKNPQAGNPPIPVYCTVESFTLPIFVGERSTGIVACDLPAATGDLPGEAGSIINQLPPGVESSFVASQIAKAYDVDDLYDAGFKGEGVKLGVIAGATFKYKDLQSFWQSMGITRDDPIVVETMEPIVTRYVETTLDTEWAGAMAPEAELTVYEGPDARNTSMIYTFNEAIALHDADVLTTSFAHREDSEPKVMRHQYHESALMAAALGITVVAASGDSSKPDTPSSSPYVTAVGGTRLTLNGNGDVTNEVAWSGSGSGVTKSFDFPYYQEGYVDAPQRAVVDVALNAAPQSAYWVYYLAQWKEYGGTSFSAPVFAGILATINSRRLDDGKSTLGFINPLLYLEPAVTSSFRDITVGSTPYYDAGPGWDYPTGLGAPDAQALADLIP